MPEPTPWTIMADGGEDITETYGFLTDILTSWNGYEQRRRMRQIALETLEFSFLAEGAEAQLAQALIYGTHADGLAVPQWHLGTRLTGAVSIGSQMLPVADVSEAIWRRSADNGGYAIVWRDPFTWELFQVAYTSAGQVHTSDTATAAWASSSALVFPARAARFAGEPQVRWLNSRVMAGRLQFTMDPI